MLQCEGLRKSFGDRTAVDGVGFAIEAGETYGLLGPNGAGKTTTISMVCGLLRRDAGRVTLQGKELDTGTVEVKAAVGFVPQELAIYPDLTARENLRFFGKLYGLAGHDLDGRIERILDTIGLAERGNERTDAYSGGMKRRLNIGLGMLNDPALLVLDEPTVGVDPQSRNAILDAVEGLASEGMAVLYTTHYMEEAERLCDRVGILDEGVLKAEGTRRELISLVANTTGYGSTPGATCRRRRRRPWGCPACRRRSCATAAWTCWRATRARRLPRSCGPSTAPARASPRWRSTNRTWRLSSCTSRARHSATRTDLCATRGRSR